MSDNIIPRINISDIPVFSGKFNQAVDIVLKTLNEAKNYCISATGAHGIVHSSLDPSFKKILKDFFLNLPDGMPNVWIGRLKGQKNMERCYGPDFFAALLKATAGRNINHFLCGGKEGAAVKLKYVCNEKFNNYNISGTLCPPFLEVGQYDYEHIGQIINNKNADIVWVGLSTPKQEVFAYNLSKYLKSKYVITVGAAFDFHINAIKQAPVWMQKLGLEWFFRLLMEPKRLFGRYLYIVPKFIYLNMLDFIKFTSSKDKK
jgi:N-acetylglucosaminyldiphosphoundecaprenol N-acetyl-beta-D-mannosaminyltransferase